jgi:hypothetical protein
MAIVSIDGDGFWLPYTWGHTGTGITMLNTIGTIDATGEKLAFIGRVSTPNRGAKTLSGVGFRFGTITKAGGSGLTVSLQDVSTSAGPPWQPDGTPDQTFAIANGNASFATATWIEGTFGSTRNVTHGDQLAVVVEYDGSGRLGADTVSLSTWFAENPLHSGGLSHYTGSWTALAHVANILLIYNDGSFGTFRGAVVGSGSGSLTYNSGDAIDEVALRFQVPWTCSIDAVKVHYNTTSASANADIILYDSSSSALVTASIDGNTIHNSSGGAQRQYILPIASTTLSANTTYRLALKPTTANDVTIPYTDVSNASHFQATPGGVAWYYSTRADGGSWTDTTTRRPYLWGVCLSGFDTGSSSVTNIYVEG